jgi:radical SAM protein with 4Fe4S-binding SPASM domain
LEHLIREDFKIQVFTNGMSEDVDNIKRIIDENELRPEQLLFCVNLNSPEDRTEKEIELQDNFLKTLGSYSYLSATIYKADQDLEYLCETILDYDLDRTIRLGLSVPLGHDNIHLPIKDYPLVADNIIKLSETTFKNKITITFDCGFPLCMFDLEELALNAQKPGRDFIFTCGTPLDIYPNLEATNCYPLSRAYSIKIEKFKTIDKIYEHFKKTFSTYSGLPREVCEKCVYFRKACAGGCKAFHKPGGENLNKNKNQK